MEAPRSRFSLAAAVNARRMDQIARWSRWPWHRVFWRLLLSGGLAIVFAMLLMRGDGEDPRPNLAQSRAAVLALAKAPVPDAENAALDYVKSSAAWVSDARVKATLPPSDTKLDLPDVVLYRPSAEIEKPYVQAYVLANATYLSLLEAAAQKSRCDWKRDYLDFITSKGAPFSELRTAARLLVLRARTRAHSGDHAGAAHDLGTLHAIARHTSADRVMLSGLVESSIHAIGNAGLQAILIYDPPALASDIEAYRKSVGCVANPNAEIRKYMESELTALVHFVDQFASMDEAARARSPVGAMLGYPMFYGSDRKTMIAYKDEVLLRLDRGSGCRIACGT